MQIMNNCADCGKEIPVDEQSYRCNRMEKADFRTQCTNVICHSCAQAKDMTDRDVTVFCNKHLE